MGGTFNDEMMAENERVRARRSPVAAARPAPEPRPAAAPAPAPERASWRLGGTVVAMMVVFAVMVLFAAALGGLFEMRGSDGATEVVSSGPVTDMGSGDAIVSWDTGGFAFDTPEGWTVDSDYEQGVVRLWTEDGDLIELRNAGRLSGDAEQTDQAFDAAFRLYDERIGLDLSDLNGATYTSRHADVAVELGGSSGEVAVMVGLDGSMWAAVYHRDSADLDPAWWEVLLTSVRPA